MTKKVIATSVVMGAMFTLIGCGGGSSDTADSIGTNPASVATTGTGYYIDSAVSGVNYTCGSQEGTTDEDGTFTFDEGTICTFTLAGVELRVVAADTLEDGVQVVEKNPRIAQLLQSLDIDGDPSNGITITSEVVAAIEAAGFDGIPTDDTEVKALVAVAAAVETFTGSFVTVTEAMEHVTETVAQVAAGEAVFNLPSTYYMVEQDSYWNGQEEVTEFEAEVMTITEATFSFTEYVFEDNVFVLDEEDNNDGLDYILKEGQWILENSQSYAVTLSEDKKVLGLNGEHQLTFKSIRNLENEEVTIDDSTVKVTMPAGAELITWEHKVLEDIYGIDEKAYTHGAEGIVEYFSSLQGVIENQCGERYFDGVDREGIDIDGIAFDCNDAGKTSGNLIGVNRGSSDFVTGVGTWEIVTLPNSNVEAIVIDIEAAYKEHSDLPFFAMKDGEAWRGWYDKAGTVEEMIMYNKVAYDAFEAKLKTLDGATAAPAPVEPTDQSLVVLLGGKTFYDVGQQVSDATDTWKGEVTFNADLTELTYTDSDSTGVETILISVTGNRLVFGSQTSYTLIGENKGDYVEVTDFYSDGTIESHTRLYFDKTKADAYFASL